VAKTRDETAPRFRIHDGPSSILRTSALYRFTEDGAVASLLEIGEMLYDHALEALTWPDWDESITRSELRAVAADLRYCARVLKSVASEVEKNEVEAADLPLCRLAAALLPEVTKVAQRIDRRVGPWPQLRARRF